MKLKTEYRRTTGKLRVRLRKMFVTIVNFDVYQFEFLFIFDYLISLYFILCNLA